MKILVACEYSGVVRDAFRKLGHDAWSCDIIPTDADPTYHIQGDVIEILDHGWDMMIAHPPCTYLTLAGNKWYKPEYKDRFPDRLKQMKDAADFFIKLANAPIKRIAIENPIGRMSSIFRKPDQIIQPYHFGHPVRKSTCLWLEGLPALKSTNIVPFEIDIFPSGNTQSKWHTETGHIKDRAERSKARSKTFQGIADAMAQQWGGLVEKVNSISA
ncbi:MAG: hypothetical protein N3I35_06595 [Clostridia bacterium]|nr:hypothetical protein [Clostridia bacterium]